jgi:hypothetical protein
MAAVFSSEKSGIKLCDEYGERVAGLDTGSVQTLQRMRESRSLINHKNEEHSAFGNTEADHLRPRD